MAIMTTMHTPGPWRVEVQTAVLNHDCRVGLLVVAPDRLWGIASVVEMPGERRDADARLIAAAPDLLAACEALIDEIRRRDQWPWVALARKMDTARAAIRAARGE